jgi:hypothetical protein
VGVCVRVAWGRFSGVAGGLFPLFEVVGVVGLFLFGGVIDFSGVLRSKPGLKK